MAHNRAPTYFATPTDRGRVEYDVDGVGTFTLGFDHAGHPGTQDDERLHVAYGRWDGTGYLDRRSALPDPPTVNRITPMGGSWFAPEEALVHLARDTDWRWSGWLTAFRCSGGVSTYVPERTRDRLAQIVATLARDLLQRPDYDELLHTHRVRLAPERADAHRQHLEEVRQELAEWATRVAHEERMLQIQEQLTQGMPWEDAGPTPRWRDYGQATTRGGEAFLIGTVGARAPRG